MNEDRRCTAHSSRTGERCKKAALRGATVCRSHGGAAPQVREAAQHRAAEFEAHREAERMVARAGVDADPIEHLLDSLYRSAALVEVWGVMVAALDAAAEKEAAANGSLRGELGYLEADPESSDELVVLSRDRLVALDRQGMAKVHPYVAEYQLALERRAKFAKLCIDAGVAERQVQIAELIGGTISAVFRGVLEELGVADHPDAPAVVRRHLAVLEGGSQKASA